MDTSASRSRGAAADPPTLSIVMPVHDEGEAVSAMLEHWLATLHGLGCSFELAVYDDGSEPVTATALENAAARHPEIVLRRHANRGHGPTILRGYREATGEWVFQADSDEEIPADELPRLWERRLDHDLVLGRRTHRPQSPGRRLVSRTARFLVRRAFGSGIEDVNSPFRLIRGAVLRELVARVPDRTFAPNVALSGLAVRRGLRVLEVPVRFVPRRSGTGSLASFRLWRLAARAAFETMAIAFGRP
jgi:dolichol-phosphate mannosyltransferase